MSYYRPQSSCGKVMFLHLSVILFTAGWLSARHPPDQRQTPPGPEADTTWTRGRHPPSGDTATAADDTHPTAFLFWESYLTLRSNTGGNKRNLTNCCFRDSFFVRDLLPCTFGKRAFYIPADLKVCILIGGS